MSEVHADTSATGPPSEMPRPRGWDAFLTPRDRELLTRSSWAKRDPFGLGSRPVVVVVDAYYAALGERREPLLESVRTWPASCGLDGWRAIDRTAVLLARARRLGVPIIYLTGLAADPVPWSRKPRGAGGHAYSDDASRAKRDLEIVAEVAPAADDLVLEKSTPSGFAGTPLDVLLRSRDRDTVILVGESSSGCVRATAVDACVLGYRVAVVEDCTFDRLQASHWMSLFDLDQKYADVVDADAVESYLLEVGAA